MLNLNDVGRPLAIIGSGKYNKELISASDKFNKGDDSLIKESKELAIPQTTPNYNRSLIQRRSERTYI